MPQTRYLNSIPKRDGGAVAGAWASTSLPRLRLLVCATARDAPYALAASHSLGDGARHRHVSPKGCPVPRAGDSLLDKVKRKRQRNRRCGARKFQHWLLTPQLVGPLRCRPCGCAPPCWYQPSWRRAAGVCGEEQLGRMCSAELTSRTDGVGFSYDRCQPDGLRERYRLRGCARK